MKKLPCLFLVKEKGLSINTDATMQLTKPQTCFLSGSAKIIISVQLKYNTNCKSGLTKQLDVDLLQRVHAAELIQFMVNLVENKGLIIISSVVPDYIHHCNKKSRYSSFSEAQLPSKLNNKVVYLQRELAC